MTLKSYRRTGGCVGHRPIRRPVPRQPARRAANGPAWHAVATRRTVARRRSRPMPVATRTLTGDREHEQVVALLFRARLVTAGSTGRARSRVDGQGVATIAVVARGRRRRPTDPQAPRRAATRWTRSTAQTASTTMASLDTTLESQAVDQSDLTVIKAAFLDASRALANPNDPGRPPRSPRRPPDRRVRRALVGVDCSPSPC